MRESRYFRFLLVALVGTLVLGLIGGCAPASEPGPTGGESKSGGTAVFRILSEPQTLTPLVSTDLIAGLIDAVMSDPLIRLNNEGEYEGRLVKDWTVSSDGLVYTFNLRDNIKWHDGTPITADDVVFTHELILNPDTGIADRIEQMINGKPIKYEKVTDKQFTVTVPEPYAPLLSTLITPIPKHIWETVDPKEYKTSPLGQKPIMSGPFKFEEYKTGEHIKFVRFDEYWEGTPYLDAIVFQIIPDNNSATVALETGQVHFSDLSVQNFNKIKAEGKLQTYSNPSGNVQLFVMNQKKAPFDDVRVRKAICHLLDKQAIVDKAFLGYAQAAHNFMVPTDMFYDENAVVKYEFNIDKAKDLLAEAGYSPGPDGIMQKQGKPLEFDLMVRAGVPEVEQAGIIIQSGLAKAGVKMNLRVTDWSQLVAIITADEDPLKFDACIVGYTMGPEPSKYSLVFSTDAHSYVTYSNPAVDELFKKGEVELDPVERQKIYSELQRIITDDAAAGFLWYPYTLYGFSPNLKVDEAEITWLAHVRFLKPGKLYMAD